MAKRLRTLFVLLSCLHLCVGVDALLQIVAWGRMVVDYSAEAGLSEGVAMTFDGQHPCRLCKAVAESRKRQEDKDEKCPEVSALRLTLKQFVHPAATVAMTPASFDFQVPGFVPLRMGGSIPVDGPPVPPPRELRI